SPLSSTLYPYTTLFRSQRKTFTGASTIVSEIYDKDYLAVGPNRNNLSLDSVYVTYTDFTEYCPFPSSCNLNTTIMQVHSTNSGRSEEHTSELQSRGHLV